jgi:hypothetical protein
MFTSDSREGGILEAVQSFFGNFHVVEVLDEYRIELAYKHFIFNHLIDYS